MKRRVKTVEIRTRKRARAGRENAAHGWRSAAVWRGVVAAAMIAVGGAAMGATGESEEFKLDLRGLGP